MSLFERAILAALAAWFTYLVPRDANPIGQWLRDYEAGAWFPKAGRPRKEKEDASEEGT